MCRNNYLILFSSFMTCQLTFNKSNMISTTIGADTVYSFRVHEFSHGWFVLFILMFSFNVVMSLEKRWSVNLHFFFVIVIEGSRFTVIEGSRFTYVICIYLCIH